MKLLVMLFCALVVGCSGDDVCESSPDPLPDPPVVQACTNKAGCEIDAGADAP